MEYEDLGRQIRREIESLSRAVVQSPFFKAANQLSSDKDAASSQLLQILEKKELFAGVSQSKLIDLQQSISEKGNSLQHKKNRYQKLFAQICDYQKAFDEWLQKNR